MSPEAQERRRDAAPTAVRVAMIGIFPPTGILPECDTNPRHVRTDHPSSWIRALAIGLSNRSDVEFRLFVHRRSVLRHAAARYCGFDIEFIPQIWPARFDHSLFMLHNALRVWPYIRRYRPHVVHGFGFETGNALLVSFMPLRKTAFVQGIVEYIGESNLAVGRLGFHTRRLGERWAARRLDGVIAESEFAASWARKRCHSSQIRVIPHAVNPEFLSSPPAAVSDSSPRFYFVGAIAHRKGLETLLKAAAALKQPAELLLIGEGQERPRYEQMARDLGCASKVKFLGHLPRERIIAELRTARGFLFPSRADTSPNAVTEAHALGLPVIASRVGGIPDMIEHEIDGFLIDMDDHERLARYVDLLTERPSLAAQMGRCGRERVSRLNSPDQVAASHAEFFRAIAFG